MSINHSWIGLFACCAYCTLVGGGGVGRGEGGCAPTGATDGPTGTGTRQDGRMDG